MEKLPIEVVRTLHDLDFELVASAINLLDRFSEYCDEQGLPSPTRDKKLDYYMHQVIAAREAVNNFIDTLPPDLATRFRHLLVWTVYIYVHWPEGPVAKTGGQFGLSRRKSTISAVQIID
jgi:hypothetical protein